MSATFIKDTSGNCSCKPATFYDGESCVNCTKHCASCKSASQCDECLSPFHPVGGKCGCDDG